MKRALVALMLVSALGCEGPEGPMGPAGPAGAQGLPGPVGPAGATRLVLISPPASTGSVAVDLPAAAGTNAASPPVMACYIRSPSDATTWLAVNDGFSTTTPWCALQFNGTWSASMFDMPAGWSAAFVILY